MALTIIQVLIFASLALSVYMCVVTLERCRSEKRYAFVYCIVTLFLYTLGYFIEISCGNVGGAIIAIKVMYSGACFMSPFFFFFVADYCELRIPKKYYRIPLLIIPILFYAVVFTFERHHLLYQSFSYDTNKPIVGMSVVPGTLYLVGTFYPLFCIVLSFIVLIRSIIAQSRGRRKGLVLLLISAGAPLIANFTYVALSFFFKTAVAGINFTAFVMVITNFIFYYDVIRNDMFDLAPKALAITMDLIRDAFVILDRSGAYMGSNKKALELFPELSGLQKGASIAKLTHWPQELSVGQGAQAGTETTGKEIEFTLQHKPGKIYSGWTNQVASDSGVTLGWVVMIQDITQTVSLIRNIQAQRDEIAAMRDNLKEGIFLMDREYKIQPSYSKAMEDILFGKELRDRPFTELLIKSFTTKDLATISDYFTMIMDKSIDSGMLEEINPLQEFSYTSTETGQQKTLRCLFAPVDQGGGEIFVMGTIQDITAETFLKKQLATEEARRQDEMRTIFEVMQVNHQAFNNFMEDTSYEFDRINECLKNKELSNRQLLVNMYQSIHSIKSNAVIVGLSSYGEKLHALETEIKTTYEKEKEPDFNDILHISLEIDKRMVDLDKFPEIINRIKDFNAAYAEGVKKDDEVFIDALKQACKRVSEDEHKKVNFVTATFDRNALDTGLRRVMKEILTQLVRNAVHHGIEKPEDRLALGKDEAGKITLSVTVEGSNVRMVLSDNGRGLNFARIAEIALSQGMLKNPSTDKNNRQLLTNCIFSPGFSTSETEDMHAGRGIGLNIVRDRVRELDGKIKVSTEEGKGTSFEIKLPY